MPQPPVSEGPVAYPAEVRTIGGYRIEIRNLFQHKSGGSGDEAYSLPADVEFVFVLAGRLELFLDSHFVSLDAGDAFTFAASTPHTFRAAPDAGKTQVLWMISPALPDSTRYP